ncbi:PREDICTED: uncharacterized protein LOC105109257 isoform X3 [Populus euphratica]|uniref:Uncharacterized protein LOC105109257 isoform X3 n=1 Tax=Populus euphratica TaxID=75702 RepID=A0AAJ6X1S1_POPEU|nr:PREDICTED: uncharacterized protein LOC105109257 isoform X3 [Populus euphratica]
MNIQQNGGFFLIKGGKSSCRGNWIKLKSSSFLLYKKQKRVSGRRILMLPHLATTWQSYLEFRSNLIKQNLCIGRPSKFWRNHLGQKTSGIMLLFGNVGAALHNLGQFYLMQRKLDEADKCYERAVKIKRRVLGLNHTDYADTLYHLGMVLYLLGKEKDAEALIQESIKILEENGMGDSITCIRRLQFLSQMYLKSNRLAEAEDVQRKVLQIMELSKGWNSMDTVIVAERLALTLQSIEKIKEAKELLERCLEARKSLLPEDHIQIAANLLHIARVAMLNSNRLRKINISEAIAELDKAKDLLHGSTRIARQVLNKRIQKGKKQKNGASEMKREGHAALVILLQSLDTLGLVETTKQELLESQGDHLPNVEAENVLLQCISSYKEFEAEKLISDSPKVKTEYLSCLKHLLSLMIDAGNKDKVTLKDLDGEIKRVEAEIHDRSKHKP